jgi:hypothetical protein
MDSISSMAELRAATVISSFRCDLMADSIADRFSRISGSTISVSGTVQAGLLMLAATPNR